jgi:hypothetical protein
MKTVFLTFLILALTCAVPVAEQKTSIYDTLAELAGPFHLYNKALARTQISYDLYPKKSMSSSYGMFHSVTTNHLGLQKSYPDWPRQVSYELYSSKPLYSDHGLFNSVPRQTESSK